MWGKWKLRSSVAPQSFALRNAGVRGIGDAMEELPGEPDGFDGLFVRIEQVAMIIYDGTLGEIGHDGLPP